MRVLAALKEQKKDFERGRNAWVEPLREWILDTNKRKRKLFCGVARFPSDGLFCPLPRRLRGTSSTFRIRKFLSAESVGVGHK